MSRYWNYSIYGTFTDLYGQTWTRARERERERDYKIPRSACISSYTRVYDDEPNVIFVLGRIDKTCEDNRQSGDQPRMKLNLQRIDECCISSCTRVSNDEPDVVFVVEWSYAHSTEQLGNTP